MHVKPLALLVSALLTTSALAREFGILNMQQVILKTDEGQAQRAILEKEIKTREGDFLKKKQEIDKLNQELQTQAALLSEDARQKKQQELQKKLMDFQREQYEFREDMKNREGQATQAIATKAAAMAQEMAKKEKLKAVFETNSTGIIYIEDPLDLTNEIIAKYNQATAVAPGAEKKSAKQDPKKVTETKG